MFGFLVMLVLFVKMHVWSFLFDVVLICVFRSLLVSCILVLFLFCLVCEYFFLFGLCGVFSF